MTQPLVPLSGSATVAPVGSTPAASASESSPAFRRLLDSLERLARPTETQEPVDDTDSLKRAIADVDSGFQQAMDLRRRLEAAFQQRTL